MATLPTVAIIGRPNTGKSTLFNRLVGRRQAIVSEVAGTTRDHVAGVIEDAKIPYLLIDTGGMGGGTKDAKMEEDVHAQSLLAIEHADVILFTVNSREELTKSDFEITDILRKRKRKHIPILMVVTKCDNDERMDEALSSYHELGIAETVLPISAPHGIGTDELDEAITEELKKLHFEKETRDETQETKNLRIALIGQPNVGKSSLINALMPDADRKKSPKLVSDVPGTTRDATDTVIRHDDKEFLFVDTAGLRKAAHSHAEQLEGYSIMRTAQAIEHCDVAVLLLDGGKPIGKQDKRIAQMAIESGKGLVLLVNKIDLLNAEKKAEKRKEIETSLAFCRYAPVLFCSAQTKEGLLKMFAVLEMVQRNRLRRIPTAELHRWFSEAVHGGPMGSIATAKHITQAEDLPPTFVLFVKDPKKVRLSQLRFMDRRLRETFGFEGSPVRWITKLSAPPRERKTR